MTALILTEAELAAVRVTLRRELRRRPVDDDRASTQNIRRALAKLDAFDYTDVQLRAVER